MQFRIGLLCITELYTTEGFKLDCGVCHQELDVPRDPVIEFPLTGKWVCDECAEIIDGTLVAKVKSLRPVYALKRAIIYCNLTRVKQLLCEGVNPNLKDGLGLTPLHTAAQNGQAEIVKVLLDYGAKVHVGDFFGHTPIDYALSGGHIELAELLRGRLPWWRRCFNK